jgi:hypothetical protein
MNSTGEPPPACTIDRVARFVRSFVDSESLAAILKHLRHEWQSVQATIFVKGLQDFLLASNLHPIPGSKLHRASPPP